MSDGATPRRRRSVDVRIIGKDYRVVTDRDEEWMLRVADLVDKAMARVRDETETVDSLDVAVLTALQLAQNLMILKDEGVVPPTAARAQNRADAKRLRDIVQIAEEAVRAEPSA
jgi:cell division protein ZapA (FtsZ GTPase activity inhibitor)